MGLKKLGRLSSLTDLNLEDCSNITDEGLKELAHLSNLTSLDMEDCNYITAAGSKELLDLLPNLMLYLHISDES